MSNFDLSALALQAVCPGNEILYDDVGMPSIMVRIPKLTYAQLGMGSSTTVHPAFIVNGSEVDAIWISKYQNVVQNGRAYSLPGQDPANCVDFDSCVQYCKAKGSGWHVISMMEWGLLKQWCQNNGFTPKGNNNYGMHNTETSMKAIPTYRYTDNGVARIGRVATGTGPLSWYHDNSPSGIADLCGNVWEWCGGVRTVYGEVQILQNNNAADGSHSQMATGSEWKAIRASDGALIAPNGSGTTSGSIKMDFVNSVLTYSTSTSDTARGPHYCTWGSVCCNGTIGESAKLLLQSLGLLPYVSNDLSASQGEWWDNAEAERSFFCGCGWGGPGCGLASFDGVNGRGNINADIGFRSAFVELPTV